VSIHLLTLVAPLSLFMVALTAVGAPGKRPRLLLALSVLAGLIAVAVAIGSALVLSLDGPGTAAIADAGMVALSVRLDMLSVIMLLLVSGIGFVVLRYSVTYLDGEERQGAFTGWLCATLGFVLLLVQAGSLLLLVISWVSTSLCLHRLLLFYPDRPAAQRAAAKKFLFARAGDAALIVAALLLATGYGTDDVATILDAARAGDAGGPVAWSAGLIALAAVLKSAQFPTHGWLTEVMEAPTPVSALLHAGVINAGGFLLIRFADVMLLAPGVLGVLVMLGGFTGLFGCLVMLTQPAVKTSLAWSTVAQMGFMVMQCGLALFPLALLHLVAHSLYKAHAFLASGGAVAQIAAIRRPGPVAVPDLRAVARAFLAGLAVYLVASAIFGLADKPPQAIALGMILIFGIAYLFAQGFADAAPGALSRRTALYAVAASTAYFALQSGAAWLTAGVLPPTPPAGPLEWTLLLLAVGSFGLVAFAQALFPLWSGHPAAAGLRVHLANGFYANAVLDRLLGGWSAARPS